MRMLIIAVAFVTGATVQQPVEPVLGRARAYVDAYENQFSALVAEEHYVQEVREAVATGGGNLSRDNPGGGFSAPPKRGQRRVLRSDYLLAKLPNGWMPFRDVFEIDGRKVRDREDRLAALFLKPTASSFGQAQRIMSDSTRYNLGGVQRTINIPTLALLLLDVDLAGRFAFTRSTDETVNGRSAAVLNYLETARPTLIRSTPDGDVPLSGRLWIDGDSGVIWKTMLSAAGPKVRAEITVTFRDDPGLKLWVPAIMEELYVQAGDDGQIMARAEYSNHRRFSVSTDENIKKPPQ